MEYGSGKHYREYALIQGINLLVNMVGQIREDKTTLQGIYEGWINSGILRFSDQIDLIFGTAVDEIKCRYMVHCINQLNSYMMSKYPKHRELMRVLTSDILNSINMAVMGSAHMWSKAQLESIQAAFMSSRLGKATPFYDQPQLEDKEKKNKKNKKREPLRLDVK